MSSRVLALTVAEAQRLQISTAKHLAWVASNPEATLESVKAAIDAYIKELEAVAK